MKWTSVGKVDITCKYIYNCTRAMLNLHSNPDAQNLVIKLCNIVWKKLTQFFFLIIFPYLYLLIRWQVQQANVLFVDNPVGAGYSYVDDLSLLTNTTEEIVLDLYTLMRQFYVENPEFRVGFTTLSIKFDNFQEKLQKCNP